MQSNKFGSIIYRLWQQEIRPLLPFALVLFMVRSSLADWNLVPSGSMKPTILEGDYVWVNKLAYDFKFPFTTWHLAEWRNPQRGDIVVFFSPKDGTRLVKRVVGLPGDFIEMRNEQLVINGKPVNYNSLESNIPEQLSLKERNQSEFATENLPDHSHAVMAINGVSAIRTFGPIMVSDNHYFMMGDNRDNSFDSRYFGAVDRTRIVGKATNVLLSLNKENFGLPRMNRTGSYLN